jgi:putative peptide zinc metalloprotease protein
VEAVEVKLAGHMDERHRATLIREVPSALNTLPSAALGQNGGGRFLIDPSDRDGLKSLDQLFVFDLSLPETLSPAPYGARVIVRFDHGTEPALQQVWRRVSQLFLQLLNA